MKNNINPARDPLAPTVAPGAELPPTITGGTVDSANLIGSVTGGILPAMAAPTGNTNNVASAMYSNSYVKTLNIGTTQNGGTIIDQTVFDPWSPSVVNPACVAYANLHKRFIGSILYYFNIVTTAMAYGKLAFAFVPESFGKDFVVTPANLYQLPHMEIDLSTSSSGVFEIKPTTKDKFVVDKNDIASGTFYGKVVMLLLTNCRSGFGNDISLEILVKASLSPGSEYIVMDESTITASAKPITIPNFR